MPPTSDPNPIDVRRDSPSRPRTAVISQSNYIPWKGYFDNLAQADVFVVFDDVQFTRRDWRNRNKIKTPNGTTWLTIPVKSKGKYHDKIHEIEVVDGSWAEKHWKAIERNYRQAAGFSECGPELEQVYARCAGETHLTEINRLLLKSCCDLLGIDVEFRDSRELGDAGEKSDRLLSICRDLGVENYLSGPAAQCYLDVALFERNGIAVSWADYSNYPDYRQLHGPFVHEVSIVDLLLNEGREAWRFLKHTTESHGGRIR